MNGEHEAVETGLQQFPLARPRSQPSQYSSGSQFQFEDLLISLRVTVGLLLHKCVVKMITTAELVCKDRG